MPRISKEHLQYNYIPVSIDDDSLMNLARAREKLLERLQSGFDIGDMDSMEGREELVAAKARLEVVAEELYPKFINVLANKGSVELIPLRRSVTSETEPCTVRF